jgi:hypothetical protein
MLSVIKMVNLNKIKKYLPLEPEGIQSSLVDEEALAALEGMVEAIDEGKLTEAQLLSDEWGKYEKHREIAERLQTFALLCSSHHWAKEEEQDFIELLGRYSFAGKTSERAQEVVGKFIHRNTRAFHSGFANSAVFSHRTQYSILSAVNGWCSFF